MTKISRYEYFSLLRMFLTNIHKESAWYTGDMEIYLKGRTDRTIAVIIKSVTFEK